MFCETVVMLSHKKPDSVINVKVEFGEGEGKVALGNIAKRESYLQNDKGVHRSEIWLQGTYRIYCGGKKGFRLADV